MISEYIYIDTHPSATWKTITTVNIYTKKKFFSTMFLPFQRKISSQNFPNVASSINIHCYWNVQFIIILPLWDVTTVMIILICETYTEQFSPFICCLCNMVQEVMWDEEYKSMLLTELHISAELLQVMAMAIWNTRLDSSFHINS